MIARIDNTWPWVDNTSASRDNTLPSRDNTPRVPSPRVGRVERQLVFIPVRRAELDAITGGTRLDGRTAHTVTPELLEALGYDPEDAEDAEYAALVLASVAALAAHGERVVVVADIPTSAVEAGTDPANGQCVASQVPASAITCWFSEGDDVDVADAAAAAKDLDIDTAWDFPQVQQLLQNHDLLWNDVVEYRGDATH